MNVALTENLKTVYELEVDYPDRRPLVDYLHPSYGGIDWELLEDILVAKLSAEKWPPRVELVVEDDDAINWDCFNSGTVSFLFSQRFIDFIGPHALRNFTPMPIMLNGAPYFALRREAVVDVFDWKHAKFRTFTTDPSRIKFVEQYAFLPDRVPTYCLFCIPEVVTEHFVDSVLANRIRQFEGKGIALTPL